MMLWHSYDDFTVVLKLLNSTASLLSFYYGIVAFVAYIYISPRLKAAILKPNVALKPHTELHKTLKLNIVTS